MSNVFVFNGSRLPDATALQVLITRRDVLQGVLPVFREIGLLRRAVTLGQLGKSDPLPETRFNFAVASKRALRSTTRIGSQNTILSPHDANVD